MNPQIIIATEQTLLLSLQENKERSIYAKPKHFHKHVFPIINQFEGTRKIYLFIFFLFVIAALAALICFFKYIPFAFDIRIVLLVIPFMLVVLPYADLQPRLEKKIKTTVMPYLMKSFGDFRWVHSPEIKKSDLTETKLFSPDIPRFFMSDDAFYGSYKGTNIKINEIGINKKGSFLF